MATRRKPSKPKADWGLAKPDRPQSFRIVEAVLACAGWGARHCDIQVVLTLVMPDASEREIVDEAVEYWRDHIAGEAPKREAKQIWRHYWSLRRTEAGRLEIEQGGQDDEAKASQASEG